MTSIGIPESVNAPIKRFFSQAQWTLLNRFVSSNSLIYSNFHALTFFVWKSSSFQSKCLCLSRFSCIDISDGCYIKTIENKSAHIARGLSLLDRTLLRQSHLWKKKHFKSYLLLLSKSFKKNLREQDNIQLFMLEGNEPILRHYKEGSRNYKVFWDRNIILCSCQNFELWGILYWHMLHAFIQRIVSKSHYLICLLVGILMYEKVLEEHKNW